MKADQIKQPLMMNELNSTEMSTVRSGQDEESKVMTNRE